MTEGSRGPEKPPLPPIEAHPEPGPVGKDLPPIERLMRKAQDDPRTRRALLVGTALAAAGIGLGAVKLARDHSAEAQASTENEQLVPEPIYAALSKDRGRLELSDVAEYWQPSFRYAQVAPGERLYSPKFREFTTDEEFQKEDNKYIEADPNNLPDGVRLKLILSERDNEIGPTDIPTSILNPKNPDETLFLWGMLADSEGNPIDPTGEPAEGKIYATSPIFFDLDEKIED